MDFTSKCFSCCGCGECELLFVSNKCISDFDVYLLYSTRSQKN